MLCHISQFPDAGRRGEVFAGFQLPACSFAEVFQQGDSQIAQAGGGTLAAKVVCFEVAVVEAVQQKVHKIRHHSFGSLGFQ